MADHDTHDHTGIPGVGGTTDLDAIITASAGQDIADALAGAAAPDAGNVFATIADVGGGGGTFVGCKAYHNTTQTNPTVFGFNSEEFDTDGYHDNSTNNSRMTIPTGKDGKYMLLATTYRGAAGTTDLWFLLNGTTALRGTYMAGTAESGSQCSAIASLVATDYVEVTTSSPGTYGHASDPKIQSSFSIVFLGA